MSGLFDWLAQSPGAGAPTPAAGAPLSAPTFNNLGLIGAGLSDVAAKMRGQPANAVANWQDSRFQFGLVQNQIAARQAYARAMQSGDRNAILSARAQLIASGAVPANYAFPQIQHGFLVSADGTAEQAVPGGPNDPRVIAQRWAARRGQVPAQAAPAASGNPATITYDENGWPQE